MSGSSNQRRESLGIGDVSVLESGESAAGDFYNRKYFIDISFRMSAETTNFREANSMERAFNRAYGFFVGLGIGFSYSYLLEVRGRKSGKIFSTPVSLLELGGKKFLVAPRGQTQWARNAEAAGEITLKRGSTRRMYRVRPLADGEKPEVLKTYLDSYKGAVQKFFPVKAGASVSAFVELAGKYPVFEIFAM
jgi:deazaflavin-dependent oxidoreductase (nitroreductase family)